MNSLVTFSLNVLTVRDLIRELLLLVDYNISPISKDLS